MAVCVCEESWGLERWLYYDNVKVLVVGRQGIVLLVPNILRVLENQTRHYGNVQIIIYLKYLVIGVNNGGNI